MLRRAKGQRRPAFGGEHVDAAAPVHAVRVRLPPGALRDIDHAGQDARGDAAGSTSCAALVPDADQVAIPDAACGGVERVDEDALREGLLQPVVVVVGGVHPCQGVMPDGLQRVFFAPGLLVLGERAFPFLDVLGHGREFRPGLPMSYSVLEKISILPLGVFSGYFCGIAAEIGKGDGWLGDRVAYRRPGSVQ